METNESGEPNDTSQEDAENETPQAGEHAGGGDQTNDESGETEDESQEDSTESEEETENDDDGESNSQEEDDDADAMVPLSKLKKVRNEARNLRDRLKAAEGRIAELEANPSGEANETLTQERDAIQAKYDALVTTIKSDRLSSSLVTAATKAGAIEPAVIAKLVTLDAVAWDDSDQPTNIDALIAGLKDEHPRLFTAVAGSGNAGSRDNSHGHDENRSTRDRLRDAYNEK